MADEAITKKKFADLPKRSLSAIIYGALWLIAIYFGGWVLTIVTYLFFSIAAVELIKLLNSDVKEKRIFNVTTFIAFIFLILAQILIYYKFKDLSFFNLTFSNFASIGAFILLLILPLFIILLDNNSNNFCPVFEYF